MTYHLNDSPEKKNIVFLRQCRLIGLDIRFRPRRLRKGCVAEVKLRGKWFGISDRVRAIMERKLRFADYNFFGITEEWKAEGATVHSPRYGRGVIAFREPSGFLWVRFDDQEHDIRVRGQMVGK